MLDGADRPTAPVVFGTLLFVLLVSVVIDGFRRLKGTVTWSKRVRAPGMPEEVYLMGQDQARRCELALDGLRVVCPASAAATPEWDASVPPPLLADGVSHFNGYLGEWLTSMLLPDVVISPEPTAIAAPPERVWDVFIDFDRYSEWNRAC